MKNKAEEKVAIKNNIYKDDDSGKMFLIALLAPFALAYIFSFVASSIADNRGVKVEVITSSLGYGIAYGVIMLAMFVGFFFLYNSVKKVNIKAAKLNFNMKWHTYLIIISIGVISLFGLLYFIGAFDNFLKAVGYPLDEGLSLINPTSWGTYFLAILVLAIFPAIYEELIFRGVILQGLRSRFNDVSAVLLTSLMFAIMHLNLQQLVYPFILGCIMGWVVLRTGSLVSSMLVHFINNFLVVTISFLSNTTSFSMALPGKWWFYVLAVCLLLVTIGIYYLIDRFYFRHKSAEAHERTSQKTSIYIYISLAVGAFLYLLASVTTIVAS